jgi:hypothetical protein
MNTPSLRSFIGSVLVAMVFFSGCSTPTLVEVARRRAATEDERRGNPNFKDDVRIPYTLTDLDVLNFTDEVKRKLASRCNIDIGIRYGSAGTEATLGALAGAADTIGWGAATASGFGMGATYVFGLGQIFDAKGRAEAFEQSFTAIQAAEATFYFHQLGMGFDNENGKKIVFPGNKTGRADIPSATNLTPDGETLYYRVTKILKVLNDTLARKIPDLQDLKEAEGESGGDVSPAKPVDASPVTPPHPNPTPDPTPRPRPTPSATPAVSSGTPQPAGPGPASGGQPVNTSIPVEVKPSHPAGIIQPAQPAQ